MTKDLEKTIAELGPGYGELVRRLRAAYEVERPAGKRRPIAVLPLAGALLAASLALVLFLPVFHVSGNVPGVSSSMARASSSNPYRLAVTSAISSIIATQNPDGSWANDYLTRQNAAALRAADSAGVPYKKALRYLKSKGLSPITPEELSSRILLANG